MMGKERKCHCWREKERLMREKERWVLMWKVVDE